MLIVTNEFFGKKNNWGIFANYGFFFFCPPPPPPPPNFVKLGKLVCYLDL
jgi:hypothetical protein